MKNIEVRNTPAEFNITFEGEANTDKMTFTGYAAVFNSPSQPLPFTEYIAPGAFKRSLKSRNEVKMFMNHNMDHVLASTRSKTLKLIEDSKGLLAEAKLPETSVGKDLSILMQRGDVNSMSFGFTVPAQGDDWSQDGMTRTLKEIRLHEVSIVTGFPAYEATTANVRSIDILATRINIDADDLADAMLRLEEGMELNSDQAKLLTDVVNKLSNKEVESETKSSIDLLQKKLELLYKAV